MARSDVIILGGGAAGLAAARRLSAANVRTVLLEARDRLGGRMHTVHDPGSPVPIELGAEFVHGKPAETWDLLRGFNLAAYDVSESHWHRVGKRISKTESFNDDTETITGRIARFKGADLTFADFLRERCRDLSPKAKQAAIGFVEGFNASDQRIVSARWLAKMQKDSDSIEGDKAFRLIDGYGRLVSAIADTFGRSVSVRLGRQITFVRGNSRGVEIVATHAGRTETYRARRAIVTLPVSILQQSLAGEGIRFDPPLAMKTNALGGLRMGSVVKVVLRFREHFWEGGDLADLGFVHSIKLPFPTWWTHLPLRVPILTGWAGGAGAEQFAGLSESDILDTALASLATILGRRVKSIRGQLVASHVVDWHADPFARGAYSYAAVNGADAPAQLAKPVDGIMFFAGEATHPTQSGTVSGALATGYRAASEILKAMK